jgi:hypothetical protein
MGSRSLPWSSQSSLAPLAEIAPFTFLIDGLASAAAFTILAIRLGAGLATNADACDL